MLLSKNFKLEEFLVNNHGIVMQPTHNELVSITELCVSLLQPIRDNFNTPIFITSGLRTRALNEKLKEAGYRVSEASLHLFGMAADFTMEQNYVLSDVFSWARNNLTYGELIFYPSEEFIHIALGDGKQTFISKDGKFHLPEYVLGG
jgi:uncharacterized protein YcbK (DUF882 family)